MEKQEIVKHYFECWISRDFSKIEEYFNQDITYRECYGPVYKGIGEIYQWLEHMLEKQIVLEWSIYRILEVSEDILVVEWYFNAKEKEEYAFDGVSVIEFSKGKIQSICEYECKHVTYRPFLRK
ncbi:nuclear transport factor 2 family protein [Enterococcus sp. BWT-B8]|uniref:nuclear transport factor 2 family protein n=1 Tax=unclassified Enterococcus TaxID=2608891 RepID=UPI001E5793D9|nr:MULTISPECIES: nuclear transport factor 2 family protein [unclassified Enterococcus]MCB5951082.1 nuclear transport factor 2 family protein [Enterococcus sp. BWT-B8]MCB5955104.1 nuclear transport factor 2 family protein [Enterococcus sp. CWB-B31]